jgi:hypothetical protein
MTRFNSEVHFNEMEINGDLNLDGTNFEDHIFFTNRVFNTERLFDDSNDISDFVGEVKISGEVTDLHRRKFKFEIERYLFSHASDNE